MKKNALIIMLSALFLLVGCTQAGEVQQSNNSQAPTNNQAQTTTDSETSNNNETQQPSNGQSQPSNGQTQQPSNGQSQPMNMEPQTPPPLTEEQKKQLEAGQAAHEPTTLTFNVVGGNFFYTPNEIRVKKGDTVRIVFENAGGYHNFVLDEFNVTMEPFNGVDTRTVEFVADKSGSFEYYCSVGKHRQMGQKGTLIVE